jgi:hypothetical protein
MLMSIPQQGYTFYIMTIVLRKHPDCEVKGFVVDESDNLEAQSKLSGLKDPDEWSTCPDPVLTGAKQELIILYST